MRWNASVECPWTRSATTTSTARSSRCCSPRRSPPPPHCGHEQNAVVEKVVHQDTLHPRDRLAAILVVVFAQQVEDITSLTWNQRMAPASLSAF